MKGLPKQTRALPTSLAPIVEELELAQPAVVTRQLLTDTAERLGVPMSVDTISDRLVRNGWLLPLRTRNSWEFSPAARAGRFRSGDPWIELRALLAREPRTPVAVAFESAVWELGHSSRPPSAPVLAHRGGWRVPKSVGARQVTFDWRLDVRLIRDLPVWCEATIVVAAAHRPSAQGDWANADEWLPEVFAEVSVGDLIEEAQHRPASTLARLGYLAQWSGKEDLAAAVAGLVPPRLPVSFLGPRDARKRWSKRWRVYDGILPAR